MNCRRFRYGLSGFQTVSTIRAYTEGSCHTEKTSFWRLYRPLVREVQTWNGDDQTVALVRIIRSRPTGKMRIVTNYRGSRKTFVARRVCFWHYWYLPFYYTFYIDNKPELERCVADGHVHWLAVVGKLITEEKWKLLLGLLVVFLYALGTSGDMSTSVEKTIEELSNKFTVPALATTLFFLVLLVLQLRSKVFVIDDVLGMESNVAETQKALRWLDTLASAGHRVVLLSSNEGIVHCFGDRNDTVRNVDKFPAPSVEVLHRSLKDALHEEAYARGCVNYCYPSESLITAVARVLPEHLAMSMRLWLWVATWNRWRLINDVAAAKPLDMRQVAELAHLAKNLDLESERHFRKLALEHSAPYEPPLDRDAAIHTPTAFPRRLVLIGAIAQLCATVEERELLEEFQSSLRQAVQDTISALRVEQHITTLDETRLAMEQRRFEQRIKMEEQRIKMEERRFAAEERRFEQRIRIEERRFAAEERRFKEQMEVHPVTLVTKLVTILMNRGKEGAHEDTHEDTHTQSAPLEDTHAQSAPREDTHAQSAPREDTHAQSAPREDTHAQSAPHEGSMLWQRWHRLTLQQRYGTTTAQRVVQRVATAELMRLVTSDMRAGTIIDTLENNLLSHGAMVVELAEEVAQGLENKEKRKLKLLSSRWGSALRNTKVTLGETQQLCGCGKNERRISWKLLPDPAGVPIGACDDIMRDVHEYLQGSGACEERCKALAELEVVVCPLLAAARKELYKRK